MRWGGGEKSAIMTWVRPSFLRYHARSKRDKSKTQASSNENVCIINGTLKYKTTSLRMGKCMQIISMLKYLVCTEILITW